MLDELVVTEELSIATEKVTEMLSLIETQPWLSVGEIESTVGDVVSVVVVLSGLILHDVLLLVSHEMTARQKLNIRKMNKRFFTFYSKTNDN